MLSLIRLLAPRSPKHIRFIASKSDKPTNEQLAVKKENTNELAKNEILDESIRTAKNEITNFNQSLSSLHLRSVRISRPSKNVMQSGTAPTNSWKIEFDSQQRWENWLMGWTSSGDPLSNLSLNFPSKEDAIRYCEKNHLQWFVEEQPERRVRRKSYADNFSWNKRTRLGSK